MTNHERFMRIPPKVLIEKNFAWHMVFCSFVEENQKYCARMKPKATPHKVHKLEIKHD